MLSWQKSVEELPYLFESSGSRAGVRRKFSDIAAVNMSSYESDQQIGPEEGSRLPPGFRFHPTDDELVSYYLTEKVVNSNVIFEAIGEVDFNKCEPWELPAKAKMSEKQFYFFSLKDKKYATGVRKNRATEAGYWKATGKDRQVINRDTGRLAGMKKTLVFYTGRAPKGEKTNWIMHEYRIEGESTVTSSQEQEWVVCRVFDKRAPGKEAPPARPPESSATDNTCYNTALLSTDVQHCAGLPGLQDWPEPPSPNSVNFKPNYMYTGLPLSDPQGYRQGAIATPSGYESHETILRRSISNAGVKREMLVGDSLDNLMSGWSVYSPDWTWDLTQSGGPVP